MDVNDSSFKGIEIPDIDAVLKDLREELLARMIRRTPVKTGTARDGWQIEGDSIVNKVPYIDVLEYGTSTQAPAGMIRISIEESPQIIGKSAEKNRTIV